MFHTLFIDDIAKPEYLQEIFLTFASHYFKFFRTDPAAKRKRDLKEVQLLPRPKEQVYKPTSLYEYVNSGRTERIVSNKLFDVIEYLQERDFADKYTTIEATRSEEWLEKCRWARKHIEAMTQIVREQAKEVLHTSLDVP